MFKKLGKNFWVEEVLWIAQCYNISPPFEKDKDAVEFLKYYFHLHLH